jgi:uncharacterized membrane protein YesL
MMARNKIIEHPSFIYLFAKTIIPIALLNYFRSLLHYQLGTQQFVKD